LTATQSSTYFGWIAAYSNDMDLFTE